MSDSECGASGRTQLQELCTVVSVMPYMLTSWAPSPTVRCHCATNDGLSASPPRTTKRIVSAAPVLAIAGSMTDTADGVCESTVIRSRRTSSANDSGSRVTHDGTTTNRPPCSKQPKISQTEKSNEHE